ncbi:MAG: aspartate--tRNA ligase, partial [Spirochaetaceae bacterium]|nr:aspartate--tRNA ligase [Spirochaetaceae bacterium]
MKRTADCGSLGKKDAGKTVILNGWIHRKRDHGGLTFLDLRDRSGLTQAVIDERASPELAALAGELRNEYCIAAEGTVRLRPEGMINPDRPTGEIEVLIDKIVILNRSEVLPFPIDEARNVKEELRLKYRYLDLRSPEMQYKIRLRSEVSFAVREWLTARGFCEIETPTFIKST